MPLPNSIQRPQLSVDVPKEEKAIIFGVLIADSPLAIPTDAIVTIELEGLAKITWTNLRHFPIEFTFVVPRNKVDKSRDYYLRATVAMPARKDSAGVSDGISPWPPPLYANRVDIAAITQGVVLRFLQVVMDRYEKTQPFRFSDQTSLSEWTSLKDVIGKKERLHYLRFRQRRGMLGVAPQYRDIREEAIAYFDRNGLSHIEQRLTNPETTLSSRPHSRPERYVGEILTKYVYGPRGLSSVTEERKTSPSPTAALERIRMTLRINQGGKVVQSEHRASILQEIKSRSLTREEIENFRRVGESLRREALSHLPLLRRSMTEWEGGSHATVNADLDQGPPDQPNPAAVKAFKRKAESFHRRFRDEVAGKVTTYGLRKEETVQKCLATLMTKNIPEDVLEWMKNRRIFPVHKDAAKRFIAEIDRLTEIAASMNGYPFIEKDQDELDSAIRGVALMAEMAMEQRKR